MIPSPVPAPDEQQAVMWRCVECGKWSHAKKRPKNHVRVVVLERADPPDYETGYAGSAAVVEERKCGPFARYEARLREEGRGV